MKRKLLIAVLSFLVLVSMLLPLLPLQASENVPIVVEKHFSEAPSHNIPDFNQRWRCMVNEHFDTEIGDENFKDECPVIEWGEYTYWVFEWSANTTRIALAATKDGQVVSYNIFEGARYIYTILK